MREKIIILFLISAFFVVNAQGEIKSLSEVFLPGKILKDNDNDSLIDTTETQIVLSDNPSLEELILAAEIAARINFETLSGNFDLVKKESKIKNFVKLKNPIFIGNSAEIIKEFKYKKWISDLKKNQAIISVFSYKGISGLIVAGKSPEAILYAGRAFFLRWPYLWDIWGRKHGAIYLKIEEDIKKFLKENNISYKDIKIISTLYEYPNYKVKKESLEKFDFNFGEIKNLLIEISFLKKGQKQKAEETLNGIIKKHRRGEKTELLNYPGCAQITFVLKVKKEVSKISIQRMGFPKRMLTPSYKKIPKKKISSKDFDLTNLFSEKGLYSDTNKDKILDSLDSYLIIPSDGKYWTLGELCSRLAFESAGISLPIIKKDMEINNYKKLISPVIIGEKNNLAKYLEKIGKWKKYPFKKNEGIIEIVPQAFNKSNALLITAQTNRDIEKTLSYLVNTYPYFTLYKEGEPKINSVKEFFEKFIEGKYGSAPSYFFYELKNLIKKLKDRELEYFNGEMYLYEENKELSSFLSDFVRKNLNIKNVEMKTIKSQKPKKIFEKIKEFPWEVDKGIKLIEEKINQNLNPGIPLEINLGVSESPTLRKKIKKRIEFLLKQKGFLNFKVNVLSAYKQGFFWIWEKVIPEIKDKNTSKILIKFSHENPDFSTKKRFYTEPLRWLQELYPIDEIISKELSIPFENINFEMIESQKPVYKIEAYDSKKKLVYQNKFYPRTKERLYLNVLPEWGKVKLTSGWLEIKSGNQVIENTLLETDLEKFWNFYQKEILPEIYRYIMKKTSQEPTFKKQPYFKRLLIEAWFSEPDFKLGIDEEIVSSLESIHDEIYFDTLDFLRGITKIEDEEVPEDTSRYSAPGNILPIIHPSNEGKKGKVIIVFEDVQAKKPLVIFKWKEKNKEERTKKIEFNPLKSEAISITRLIYNCADNKIKNLLLKMEFKDEKDYLKAIDLILSFKELRKNGLYLESFSFPGLETLTFNLQTKKLEKEIFLELFEKKSKKKPPAEKEISFPFVPTNKIISPVECWNICKKLGSLPNINFYIGGYSYENRKIPVLEIYLPKGKYISKSKLITMKPTIYISGRQHANEVSSTNYILKLAELLATDKKYQNFNKKINFVLHPMENPDGAQLAYELQKITPFHSLHAGRYSALGIDVGYQVNVKNPILPEAKVRKELYEKWLPDIYLNLHGYPSHEWIQQFSNYSPYLFRDYWIPRGWFAYYNYLRLPIYEKWKIAGENLKIYIIEEMNKNEKSREFNKRLYNRYYRWAGRWQPHMNFLEIYQDVNLYAERRSPIENKLTPRREITFVEEVPEVMDETAYGGWLEFLCEQGLTYLTAHLKYLSNIKWNIVRLEEEYNNRIQIKFIRARPGKIKSK